MLALRQKAFQASGRLPLAAVQATRQYSSPPAKDDHHGDHSDHGHGDHGHHHAEPQPESLGTGFFLVLATIPLSLGVYAASRPDKDGNMAGFSKFIDGYSYYQEKWKARNTLHTAAIEQAAFNRNLLHGQKGTTHVDLKFPEVFNRGSPWNVVAGQGPRNMDAVVAHYTKINADEASRREKAMAEKQ
ncbi:hypothetical protein HYFRA_00012697 [Hymenoscyphus fraxineus]|uniref:NADH-ubiquinone oxidoreductase 17.8 kDa subunit n=1 Tax=Hymenoscyphus fraxineus TaxID=746836 RepID=A0A9N9L468_9HELO|nr:hypothetical protein HYFRA_00012697 [Hymenoscyphus fraxineus]